MRANTRIYVLILTNKPTIAPLLIAAPYQIKAVASDTHLRPLLCGPRGA